MFWGAMPALTAQPRPYGLAHGPGLLLCVVLRRSCQAWSGSSLDLGRRGHVPSAPCHRPGPAAPVAGGWARWELSVEGPAGAPRCLMRVDAVLVRGLGR